MNIKIKLIALEMLSLLALGIIPVVLQPLIDTFIHKTLIHPQYLDFFMSSLMHFFVVLYCVSRETMV